MMMFSSGTNVGPGRRIDDDLAAGEPLAEVIVGVAFEHERHAARHERAEALAGRALEMDADRVVGQGLAVPYRRVISLPTIVPTTRLTLRIGSSARTVSPRSMAGSQSSSSVVLSSDFSRP